MNSVQQQINSLREVLNRHNHEYYVLDNATISDYEFDIKLKELEALEEAYPEYYNANSPSQRVGGTVSKNFQTLQKYTTLQMAERKLIGLILPRKY